MSVAWAPYFLTAAALLASSTFTGVARRVAIRAGILDRPDGLRKLHGSAIPLMGGAAIYGAFSLTVLVATLLPGSAPLIGTLPDSALPMLLLSGGLFCGLGLYDDIRPLRPWQKFAFQFLAALPFAVWGQKVSWIEFLGFDLTLGSTVGALVTALWIVACANTINLIDGLDGLAATVGLIACVGLALIADIQMLPGVAALALIAAGSLTGFLCHNLPPARIFLGDSGSLLIGFLIGALSIESAAKTAAGFAMTVPVILISVPAFDTGMAILRRRLTGRGIGEGDRGHIHHKLQERGLTRTQTLIVIAGLCSLMAALTVLSVAFEADRLCVALCTGLLGLLIVGRVFGHQETFLLLRRVQRIGQVIAQESTLFSPRSSRVPSTWETAVELAEAFGLSRFEITRLCDRDGVVIDRRHWVDPACSSAFWEVWVTARSGDGQRLTIRAAGADRGTDAAVIGHLFVLLDECCRKWVAAGGSLVDGPDAAVSFVLPAAVSSPVVDSARRAA